MVREVQAVWVWRRSVEGPRVGLNHPEMRAAGLSAKAREYEV